MALALKLIPADMLGKPYQSLTDVSIGSFAHHPASGATFRILCNCATAQPKEHTQRHVAGRYTEHRYPTEDEIRTALAPRVAAPPIAHHPV